MRAAETHTEPAGPPRSDAGDLQARVLAAAREVLGEAGPEASMEQIAARAGVGVATVYRRFPGKNSLLEQLVITVTEELVQAGERILAEDRGEGLERYLREIGHSLAQNHRWAALLFPGDTGAVQGTLAVRACITKLLANAQRHGTLSPEAAPGDVLATIWGMRGLIEVCGDVAPNAWIRFLDIQLTALRAPGPLSAQRPITARQVQQLPARRPGHGSR